MIEEELTGGNTTHVVRIGDTVRRAAGPWSPAVHSLLRHLERAGFDGSPRVLGMDDDGREVLGFVAGEVGTLSPESPLPAWFATPEALRSIGAWLKAFQEAQRGFAPDPAVPWRRAAGRALAPGEVIAHHDVSPYNTVRRDDGRLVVLDWDFCRPGDPLDDLAWAAWRWVPLMTGTWWHRQFRVFPRIPPEPRQREFLHALLEGYGPTRAQLDALPQAIEDAMRSHASDLEDMARADPAFAALLERNYAAHARADADWWRDATVLRDVISAFPA